MSLNLYKFTKNLDIFGQPIRLYLNHKNIHKTFFGGLLTLGMIIAIIVLSIKSCLELTQRGGVNVQQNVKVEAIPRQLYLPREKFIFAINTDDQSITLNNSIYTFNIINTIYIKELNGTTTKYKSQLPMKKCELLDFKALGFEQKYSQYHLDNAICTNSPLIELKGDYISNNYTFIEISVTTCSNTTNPLIKCAPPEVITEYQKLNKKTRVQLFFQNYIINTLNYETPINTYLDQISWIISPGLFSIWSEIFIRESIIQTAANLFNYGDPEELNGFRYSDEKIDQVSSSDGNKVLNIFLRKSSYIETHFRKYKTLGDVFAVIGGFWNFLFLVVGIFALWFNTKRYNLKLANALYDFEEPDESSTKKDKFQEKLRFNSWEIFQTMFLCGQKRLKNKECLIKNAIKKITNDVDIVLIMRKLHEIDKIKQILFTHQQLVIFDNIPQPIITLQPENISMKKKKSTLEKEKSDFMPKSPENLLIENGNNTHEDYFSKKMLNILQTSTLTRNRSSIYKEPPSIITTDREEKMFNPHKISKKDSRNLENVLYEQVIKMTTDQIPSKQ